MARPLGSSIFKANGIVLEAACAAVSWLRPPVASLDVFYSVPWACIFDI